jgi:hypothetical protein
VDLVRLAVARLRVLDDHLDGEDLSQRIARGPMARPQALAIARET